MESPIRRDDLDHTRSALRERMEENIARDKLSLVNIEPFPFGFVFRPALSARFRSWWETQSVTPRFWLDSAEIDSFGSQLLVARDPFGPCAALCFWQDFSLAANHLRIQEIGPALWAAHKTLLLGRIINELIPKLGLIKRPLNSQETPSYADTEWGILVHLKCEQATELLEDYFCVPVPRDRLIPSLVNLGGNVSGIIALGPQLARLGLCFNGLENPTVIDLQEWLSAVHKPQSIAT
jgi:hypothetical protein